MADEFYDILDEVSDLLSPDCIHDDEVKRLLKEIQALTQKCFHCAEIHECRPRVGVKLILILKIWHSVLPSITDGDSFRGGFCGLVMPPPPDSINRKNPCPKMKPNETIPEEDHSDDICPCGDCERPFGHEEGNDEK